MTSPREDGVAALPVIRAVVALGPLRLFRIFTAFVVVGAMAIYLVGLRPDLARPADLTTDTSNYLAAGERIADGHEVYALTAGDRPAPADNEPWWTVPLLAPPSIGVLFAALQLGPPALVMHLWWLGGVALTAALALHLAARLPAGGLVALCLLAYPMAEMAWSGNVTAYVIPATAAAWWLTSGPTGRRAGWAAGAIVGALTLVRLTPLVLAWWFVLRRRSDGVAATAMSVIAGVAVTAIIAGPSAWTEFLGLARDSALPTGFSLGGQLRSLFGPGPLVTLAPALAGVVGVVLATTFRHRPRVAFAILVTTSVLATPALRAGTFGMLVAALAPWTPAPWGVAPRAATARAGAAGLAAVAAIAVVLAAQVPSTTVVVRNESAHDVVVRFQMIVGTASFGYAVDAGAEGWAWSGQAGSMPAIVRVFDASCGLLLDERTIAGDDLVLVTDDGASLAGLPGSLPRGSLPYSDGCVGVVEPTTP